MTDPAQRARMERHNAARNVGAGGSSHCPSGPVLEHEPPPPRTHRLAWLACAPLAVLLGALIVALAGCGTASEPSNGAAVFVSSCGGCHSLGTGVRRRQGGDLLSFRMSEPNMIGFTRQMPARHRLSDAQVRAVANYVLAQQARVPAPG